MPPKFLGRVPLTGLLFILCLDSHFVVMYFSLTFTSISSLLHFIHFTVVWVELQPPFIQYLGVQSVRNEQRIRSRNSKGSLPDFVLQRCG